MEPLYAALAAVAERRHGVFTRAIALDCAVTDRMLDRLVARGWAERVGIGVYRVAGSAATDHQRLMAATDAYGPSAAASHRSGAWLWELARRPPREPHVVRLHSTNRRSHLGIVHGTRLLPPDHLSVRDGIPVTTVPRTIFDLAAVARPGEVARVLDAALARRVCSLHQVQVVFFALAGRGRTGTVTMRHLLADRGQGYVPPASELERVARALFTRAGLPSPAFEVELGDDDVIGRVDCLWREAMVVVELDGRRFHDGLSARRADRLRDNRLMAAGWRVLRFTWDDLHERPHEVIRLIQAALAR